MPDRDESPWYSTQSPEMRGDGVGAADAPAVAVAVAALGVDDAMGPPPHAVETSARHTLRTAADRPLTAPS
jgi:hypothetical protein